MGRIVALLNQKGGVGKTTVVLGLASAAAQSGQRVLVVDLDPQASSTWALGVEPSDDVKSAADLLEAARLDKVTVDSEWTDRIRLVPASQSLQDKESGNPKRLRSRLNGVAERYDAVLIDCPPSLGNLTASGLSAAHHALVVVEPSALGLRGIGAVADVIDEVWERWNPDLDFAGVIVNKVPPVSSEADRRYDELTRIVGKRAIWKPAVPQRVIVNQAIGERRPIHSYGARAADVSAAFDALWARLRRVTR